MNPETLNTLPPAQLTLKSWWRSPVARQERIWRLSVDSTSSTINNGAFE